jgi:hypothetical protein
MSTATATPLATVTPLVKEWCAAHADRIQACYLKAEADDVVTLVLVQRRGDGYDDLLADELHDGLTRMYRTTGVVIVAWQSGPGSEEYVCQVYPVKPTHRVYGE